MPQIDEPTTPAPKVAPETSRKPKPPAEKAPPGIYSFTINPAEGRILTVERVDGTGQRHPLTAEEKTHFSKWQTAMPLRRVVEQAFEAGIECVLGEGAGTDVPETKEDTEISGILLQTLIEGSKAKELVKGDNLDRTLIATLIGQASKPGGPATH